jgi:Tol biopolymer transport system component
VLICAAALVVGAPASGASSSLFEIYAINPNGSGLVDLSNNPANDSFPVESQRGRRIAFVSDRDGYDAIYVMNDDGSDQRRLTDQLVQADTPCRLHSPLWSPKGATIAFTAICPLPNGDPRDVYDNIYVIPLSGGSARELVPGGTGASFSADGRFIAYTQQTSVIIRPVVGLIATAGGKPLTLGEGYAPVWSPTGHRLAFWRPRGLTVVNVPSARRWTLRNAGPPAWSPRGDLIAFWRDGAHPAVYLVHPGARRASRLVDLREDVIGYWARNGRWLALKGLESTYVVARNGRFLRRIGGSGSDPVWSRDSSHVAWADPSLGGLVVTKPRDRGTTLLVQSTDIRGLTWTRDSRRIIFANR